MRVLAFLLGAAITTLAGCSLNTNYFSDYTGTNLLSSYEFNASGWATDTKGLDNSSSSDLYMNWASASATGPGGGAAYKLEILNLIPDGNFANGTINSSYWSYSSSTPTIDNTGRFNPNIVYSLYYSGATSTSAYLNLDLAASLKASTGLSTPASHLYQFQTDFIDTGSTPFYVTNNNNFGGSTSTVSIAQLSFGNQVTDSSAIYSLASVAVITSLNLTFTSSSDSSNIFFGYFDRSNNPNQTETFYLDNVRLVPDNVDLYTRLSLPSLGSTSKQLIPGTYQFSLYVKDDPNAGTTSNHFYAKGLTVRVTAATKSNLSKQVVVTAARTSSWASWTKLTFSLGTLDFVDSGSALTTYPALVIEISPTIMNSGTRDSGAVYISDPTLTFISS